MNTGGKAQLEYTGAQGQIVSDAVAAWVSSSSAFMAAYPAAHPAAAAIVAFQVQAQAGSDFIDVLRQLIALVDPSVTNDGTRSDAILHQVRTWAGAYDAFTGLSEGACPAEMQDLTNSMLRLIEAVGDFIVRIAVSTVATQAMEAGAVDPRSITGAALADMATAYAAADTAGTNKADAAMAVLLARTGIANTGTLAQVEYIGAQAREVANLGATMRDVQIRLMANPDLAGIPEFQAQYSAMIDFHQAMQQLDSMFDPSVAVDQAKLDAVMSQAKVWGKACEAFLSFLPEDATAQMRGLLSREFDAVGQLITRICVSGMATQEVAAGTVKASATTGAALAEMETALDSGSDASRAVLRGAGSAVPVTNITYTAPAERMAAAPQIQVKRYKNEKDYEREARRMLAEGWRIEGQSSQRGNVNMGQTVLKAGVFLPWAMMRPSRKGDPITVTWLRGG